MAESAADILRNAQGMKSKKENFIQLAQDSARFNLPHRANIAEKKSEGTEVDPRVFDGTGQDCTQICASGIQTYLVSPYSQWFELGFRKKEHRDNKDLMEWAVEAGKTLYEKLNASNFNRNMAEFLLDLVALPGATLYKEADPNDIFRFKTIPFDEVLIRENSRGQIDTIYRQFKWTVYEAYDRWKEAAGEEISKLYKEKKYDEKFDFTHAVAPRAVRNVAKKDNKNMAFYSCYVLDDKKKKIEESGYVRCPYYIGRWGKVSGMAWAYPPGVRALPDLRMLNRITEENIISVQTSSSPAWMFPDENFLMPLNMNPRGINYRTGGALDRNNMPYPLVSGGNAQLGIEFEKERRMMIEKRFFVHLFTINYQEMEKTAYEIAQQAQRNMLIVGSVIGDLIKEVLEPLLEDCLQDAYEAQELPEVPVDGIKFEDLAFNYISPLAIAQKAAKAQNLNAYLSTVLQMATGGVPDALKKIDWFAALEELGEIHTITPKVIKSKEVVDAQMKEEARLRQQANEMALAAAGGSAMKSIGEGAQALNPPKPTKLSNS